MYRYLFFDLDGTLTDSQEGIINCLRYAFAKLGKPVPEKEMLLQFIGPPLQDSFARFAHFDPDTTARAIAAFRERYVPVGKFENTPAPGAAQMLALLKAAGYTLALASSKPQELCQAICEKFAFAPYLTTITGSPPEADWSKGEVIRQTMSRLDLDEKNAAEILMVGDRKFDVLGAREWGVDCVGVEFFGYAQPGELKEAGAVAVVKTVEELEQFILTH